MTVAWKGWRPLKWTKVEEIKPLIEKYFKETPKDEWTITWLAIALDTSRTTLIDYENMWINWRISEEFTNTIKKAKDIVENWYEIDLKKKGNTWTIFALKNFWWEDKKTTENTTRIDLTLNEEENTLLNDLD